MTSFQSISLLLLTEIWSIIRIKMNFVEQTILRNNLIYFRVLMFQKGVCMYRDNSDFLQKEMMQDLAENLPDLRRKLKITQTELGKRVGLSRQTISSIERKTVTMTWNNYLALMMFFTANSTDVFYIPKNSGEYRFSEDLAGLLKIKNY